MQGRNGTARDARKGLRAGCTKVETKHNRGTYPSAPVAAVLIRTPPPNNKHAMETRRPFQNKNKNKKYLPNYNSSCGEWFLGLHKYILFKSIIYGYKLAGDIYI